MQGGPRPHHGTCKDPSAQGDAADDPVEGFMPEGSLQAMSEGFQEAAQSLRHAAGPWPTIRHSDLTACRLLKPCGGDRVKEALDRGGRRPPDVRKGFVRFVVGLFHRFT